MIDSLIIDDEQHCITTLRHDVELFCPQVRLVGCYENSVEGLAAIRRLKPQLVFLDIEMPHINGFELLRRLGEQRDFEVIFTTAYDQFMLKALRLSAIDYLLKPVDGMELAEAVIRAEKQIALQKNTNERIESLLYNNLQDEANKLIAMPNRHGYEFVKAMDICYCQASGAYTNIVTSDGREILLSKALGETEAMLPHHLFERIHHSTIVNIRQIKQFNKSTGLFIVMANGHSLNVARSKKDHLLLRMGIK